LDWDQSFFHHMMDAYYHDKRSYITREAVYVFINSLFEKGDLFVDERGNISIANKDMIEGIEKIRYEVMESGRFKREELLSLQNAQWSLQWFKEPFTYKDFKWLMESTYAEMQLDNDTLYPFIALDYDRGKNPWLAPFFTSNSMNSILTNTLKNDYIPTSGSDKVIHDGKIEYDEEKDIIFLPHPYPYYSSWGFIVNKKGKNIDAGLEFINMLLSDEVQLRQYKNAAREVVREHMNSRLLSFSTPVVNTIESELDSADKSENVLSHYTSMRKEILRQILEGERMRGYRGGSIRGAYPLNINLKLTEEQEFFFKEELEKVIVDVVFSDERYSSEKIMMELRKLENRLMLMFSE
ncbi:MAG: extracellular solute-binding protein, partial [Gottschalkiaceae bacterium]